MKIRDKQRWLSNQMSWLTRNINLIFTLVLLLEILPNCSHGFKYIALASTTSKVNATSPEIQFHVNNVTLTDNTISDNDSEEGHAKVVKTISSLLAESLNKSIGHFQYIQENRDSTSSERQLRLSLTTTTSTLTGPDEGNANNHKEPCTESRRSDDTLEDDGNSDESKSVILGNSANGLNDSIISVTLTSKTVSDGLQDDKTGPTTINPSNLVTRVTGSSILTDKLATVYYGDQDEDDTSNDSGDIQKMNNGDGMNLRKYFKPITTTLPPEPSPVYQPEEAVKVVPIGQNNANQNVNERKDKNNGTQFICIKVINGKLTYPSMAKLVYPQLKETSLVMPTVPKIPLSYLSFKKYVTNDSYNDSSTESIFNGTNDSVIELNEETKSAKQPNSFGISGRQPKHYVQRYYPVNLYSLDSIQKKNVSYTLKSSLSFDPGDNETHYLNNRRRSSVTANNDATTGTTANITTTTPTIDPLVSEKSTDLNTFSHVDSDKIKYKPITYKTTVIIPKITTTTVSLSTNYPKSSSAEPMTLTTTTPLPSSTEMSSIHSSNKIIHEFKDKKDSKYETNKKKHDKESVKSNKKSDKSTKKEIQMMNSGSSISSQRLVSSRLRFPDSNSANIQPKPTPIDTSFDSFEIPSEEPIIIPNSMIRPPFGLTTIVPNGLQHQVSASNPNPFQSHHHYNNVNLHQKKYQQLSTPITVNQHSLVPEVLQSSTIMPNELTDNPLISLMNPSIGSSYRGLASKLKSAINFSPKQQQQMYPNQQSHYQNSYSFVPSSNQMSFGYNGYDQSGLESVYKLNPHSTTNDMVYYDPRLNYKPEVSLMTPYLPNLQGSYVRQPASKFLRQYQALVTSASSMVQRNPSQSIQFNHNPSQSARQPSQLQHNRQQLIPPTNFYPVFQPIQSLSLNPQTFQDPHEIHQHSNYYHQQQDLRPKVSTSIHHKLKPEHINLLEQGDSSSITSVSRASVASGSKLSSSLPSSQGSTTDDKQLSKSSRKNRSKTGSTFRSRNSRTKSKRKSKQNSLSGNSSLPSKSPKSLSTSTSLSIETFQKSSPKTLSNPCSSSDSTNCQSLGGLLFSPSRSVKFELRDALS